MSGGGVIPFNRPLYLGEEMDTLNGVIDSGELSGNGRYTKRCEKWLQTYSGPAIALITLSCTHTLEMAALLVNIEPGDEVIMPSWMFVNISNAFVLRGAVPVYFDVELRTCNLDVDLVESAMAMAKCRLSHVSGLIARYLQIRPHKPVHAEIGFHGRFDSVGDDHGNGSEWLFHPSLGGILILKYGAWW